MYSTMEIEIFIN